MNRWGKSATRSGGGELDFYSLIKTKRATNCHFQLKLRHALKSRVGKMDPLWCKNQSEVADLGKSGGGGTRSSYPHQLRASLCFQS